MLKLLVQHHINIHELTIGLFGVSYKANTIDARNSLSLKLMKELREEGFQCLAHDPLEYPPSHSELTLKNFQDINKISVAILLVPHDAYRDLGLQSFVDRCQQPAIFMDIPHLFIDEGRQQKDLIYWAL